MPDLNYQTLFAKHHHWQIDNSLTAHALPLNIQPWMLHQGSLTAALKQIADGTFEVKVLQQKIALPLWHEQQKLARELHLAALIRQVELHIYGEAVVYARSIIPLNLAASGRRGLGGLGSTPLGHLLFNDGRVRISKREFLRISSAHQTLYARRTPYDYLDSQILVSEVFLPALFPYISA